MHDKRYSAAYEGQGEAERVKGIDHVANENASRVAREEYSDANVSAAQQRRDALARYCTKKCQKMDWVNHQWLCQ